MNFTLDKKYFEILQTVDSKTGTVEEALDLWHRTKLNDESIQAKSEKKDVDITV